MSSCHLRHSAELVKIVATHSEAGCKAVFEHGGLEVRTAVACIESHLVCTNPWCFNESLSSALLRGTCISARDQLAEW